MTVTTWQELEADAHEVKADELDHLIETWENLTFLQRDPPPEQVKQVTATLALVKGFRNDYRQQAEELRG